MLIKSGDAGNSLSLALSARLAVKALLDLQKQTAPDAGLAIALKDVVTSLNAISAGGPLFGHLTSSSNFEHYEQIQTLAEVRLAYADDRLAEKLQSVMTANGNVGERERSIDFAIDFFTALESRALQKYNQAANPSF
jgi:hypothetical protein